MKTFDVREAEEKLLFFSCTPFLEEADASQWNNIIVLNQIPKALLQKWD